MTDDEAITICALMGYPMRYWGKHHSRDHDVWYTDFRPADYVTGKSNPNYMHPVEQAELERTRDVETRAYFTSRGEAAQALCAYMNWTLAHSSRAPQRSQATTAVSPPAEPDL